MGGVVLLLPRECLNDGLPRNVSSPMRCRKKSAYSPRSSSPRSRAPDRGGKSAPRSKKNLPATDFSRNLVLGQVKILKRGEVLETSIGDQDLRSDTKRSEVGTVEKDCLKVEVSPDDRNKGGSAAERRSTKVQSRSADDSRARITRKNLKIEQFVKKNLKIERSEDDSLLSSTNRLGPDPETLWKHTLGPELFSGSAIIESPPPSSLPFPAFFSKNPKLPSIAREDPSTDLRRILRLDLV